MWLILARHDKARDVTQQVGFSVKRLQRRYCLLYQLRGAAARAVEPEEIDECRLAGGRIFLHRLAEISFVAFNVE